MAKPRLLNMAMVAYGTEFEFEEVDIVQPGPDQVLVNVLYAAQNPTDVQSFDKAAFGDESVYGCDFVGKVIETGDNVSKLKPGDVIAGLIWGGEVKERGAYSWYTIADQNISFKVPDGFDYASASTVPLAATTAWLALFSKGCLNIQRGRIASVLIWGGSSSVGQYAIQLASLHGLNVITTCSPKNFDLVEGLGASYAFDYNSASVTEDIRQAAPDLSYVFDTIGNTESSAKACEGAASNCTLCTVRPGKANTEDVPKSVKITDVLVWTAFPKAHSYGEFHWPMNLDDHKLSTELHASLPQWLQEGKIKPNKVHLLKRLGSVPEGFQLYREGKLSAEKVVYKVSDA